jgi:hypothetical protein
MTTHLSLLVTVEPGEKKNLKQVRIYIDPNKEADTLHRLKRNIGKLSEADIASLIVAAGLRACEEAGYRLPLPLKFDIVEDDSPQTTDRRVMLNDKSKRGK